METTSDAPYYVVGRDSLPDATQLFSPLFLGIVAVLLGTLAVAAIRKK